MYKLLIGGGGGPKNRKLGMTMDGPIFPFLIITNFIQCNKTAFLFKF